MKKICLFSLVSLFVVMGFCSSGFAGPQIGRSGGGGAETDPIVGAVTGIVLADGGGNISAAVADTDYQATHALLRDIAGLSLTNGDIIYYNGSNFVVLDSGTANYLLQANGAAAPTWVNSISFATLRVPNDESADGTLANLGDIHVRGDEDRFSLHMGAGGEIAGEATKSMLDTRAFSYDPGAWYDSDTETFLFEVDAKIYPNGIIIDYWSISCNCDPDVEIDADLRYADAWITLANPADIDEIDTTAGVSSEDTDANINAGAAVAAGKVIYIGYDADPEGTCTQLHGKIGFHGEED